MDRRIILGRMSLLKERLAEIDKQKTTQRKTEAEWSVGTGGLYQRGKILPS